MKKVEPPKSAPSLVKMGEKKAEFEAKREELFPEWKAALEEAKGNITHASVAYFFSDVKEPTFEQKQKAKSCAMFFTRKLDLVEYAKSLRVEAGQSADAGRPKSMHVTKSGKSKGSQK